MQGAENKSLPGYKRNVCGGVEMRPEETIKIAIHCFGVQAEQEVCEECPVYLESGIACREVARVAISALKEVQQYRAIGTVEECREAVEKQKAKKPRLNYKPKFFGRATYTCPRCGNCCLEEFANERQNNRYCWDCGQKIDFGGNRIGGNRR